MTEELVYLGPPGTFSEMAALALPGSVASQIHPAPSVMSALGQVRAGSVAGAVVPIENSVEGSVSGTLDELAAEPALRIAAEIAIPVRFVLMRRPDVTDESVAVVATHPHAAAQCRRWIHENLPNADIAHTDSTADAAQRLAAERAPSFDAAIGTAAAAERYGLEVVASDIADNREAETRFVKIVRPGPLPTVTGTDKTSLVLYIHANRAGALLEILTELATRDINMTRLESRPTRHALGDYCFSVDLAGHVAEPQIGEALIGLRRVCADVLFLGSYPRSSAQRLEVSSGRAHVDDRSDVEWLADIRSGKA